jgi:hypothetical protein
MLLDVISKLLNNWIKELQAHDYGMVGFKRVFVKWLSVVEDYHYG